MKNAPSGCIDCGATNFGCRYVIVVDVVGGESTITGRRCWPCANKAPTPAEQEASQRRLCASKRSNDELNKGLQYARNPPKPAPTLVIIESPFGSPSQRKRTKNRRYAQAALLDSLRRGEAPYASHLLYPQVLDDENPEERTQGIEAGLVWGRCAKKTVVYEDLGVSRGMKLGIERAQAEGHAIEYRKLGGKWR